MGSFISFDLPMSLFHLDLVSQSNLRALFLYSNCSIFFFFLLASNLFDLLFNRQLQLKLLYPIMVLE